jgi:hypothetical protein
MPATDTIDFEREFEELVRELRAVPAAAPDQLRERVRTLGEPAAPSQLWDRLRGISIRRSLLVLAPACAVALVAAAVVHGVLNSGPKREAVATPQFGTAVHGAGAGKAGAKPWTGAQDQQLAPMLTSPLPAPSGGRRQDYQASMTLRVSDADALTQRTNDAMQIVRSYGGFVASVEQSTSAGQPGRADLVLRVPVARVEEALVRLSGLGTVTERHLSIRDLEQTVNQQRARIVELKVLIARVTETLKGSLAPDVRLRLQLQLEEARRELAQMTSANKATLREAALSRVSLTLTTQKVVTATKKGGMGRIERAARDAGSFLEAAGAIVLFLLIVVSPLIVLALVAAWGTRIYRAREQRRLLA